MRGRFDEGRSSVRQAQTLYDELGQAFGREACGFALGMIEMLADRPVEAERALRESVDACTRLNASALLATRAAQLADAIYLQGRYAEADTWVRTAREHASEDDRDAQFHWRSVEAKLRARRGEFSDAERLGREANALVEQTDALNYRAKALLDLGEILRLAERPNDANDALERAAELFEAKGNTVAAEKTRRLVIASSVA